MILAEDLAIMDWNSNMRLAKENGIEQGIEKGQDKIIELNKWLFAQNRDADVRKATEDPEFLKSLLQEYSEEHPSESKAPQE